MPLGLSISSSIDERENYIWFAQNYMSDPACKGDEFIGKLYNRI